MACAPDRIAVVDGERRLTYAQADACIAVMAADLLRRAGDAPLIAGLMPNCLEYVLLYWAVVRVGGRIAPLNTWLKGASLERLLDRLKPDLLIQSPGDVSMAGGESLSEAVQADPDSVAVIMHTSGTTGVPKGAVMRHSDIMFNITTAIHAHGFNESDVNVLTNPFFHCAGFYTSLPLAAYTQTPFVVGVPTRSDELLDLVEREHVTTIMSIPSVFKQLVHARERGAQEVSSLRLLAYAGSPMPVEVVRGLREVFPGVALQNFFGLTETISMTHVLRDEDTDAHPDSIGKPLPGVGARIADADGKDVPPGQAGELMFARENVIAGYFREEERLEASFVEQGGRTWFRTGDLAAQDADGFTYLKGRKKDMIIVGGENVYAAELEVFLSSHQGVREAAVKGVPATGARSFLGEQIVAYVVLEDETLSERDIRKYCFENVPSYAVPQSVVFLESLPRNPGGKVMKDRLEC